VSAYSLELTIDGAENATKVFRAVKAFDATAIMGSTLQRLRERKPLEVQLDCPDRTKILQRLIGLLDELDRLGASYQLSANHVPRTSPSWKPKSWVRSDVVAALAEAEAAAAERKRADEILKDYVPPDPPPSKTLFEQRWADMPYADLLPSEQRYVTIWAMRAEVNNGGFATFFDNSAGDTALEAQAILAELGSSDVHAILSDALQLLEPAGGFTATRSDRFERTGQLAEDVFTDVDSRFYDTHEDVVGMAFQEVAADYEAKGML